MLATAWLVNTGCSGGAYGTGSRMKLKYTRAIIDAIQSGAFDNVEVITDADFGFNIPTSCPGVPADMLQPRRTWADKNAYDATKQKLIKLFQDNFKKFEAKVNPAIVQAGPKASQPA